MPMTRIYMIVSMFIMLLLASCSSQKSSTMEKIHYPVAVRSGQQYTEHACHISQAKWWKPIHDKQLDELIATALATNNQIKTAYANLLQARAKLQEAHAAWLPTLD